MIGWLWQCHACKTWNDDRLTNCYRCDSRRHQMPQFEEVLGRTESFNTLREKVLKLENRLNRLEKLTGELNSYERYPTSGVPTKTHPRASQGDCEVF